MARRLTRRGMLGLTGAAVLGGAAAATGIELLGSKQQEGPRNVVLIVVDTLRADHLGCHGNELVQTPHIDGLARDGLRFTRVFPEAMPTVPARRSLMTGRRVFPFRGWRPWDGLGSTPGWAPIMPGEATLATELRRRGYWTGYVTDTPFLARPPAFQPFRESFHRFRAVDGQGNERRPLELVSERSARRLLPRSLQGDDSEIWKMRRYLASNGGGPDAAIRERETAAARVFADAMETLATAAKRRRPFLLVVDSFDPHEPWTVSAADFDRYGDPGARPIGNIAYTEASDLTDGETERLRATYAGAVTMVDRWVGTLLERLDRLGLAGNTAVVLVSDHGIHLGERDWVGKSAWRLHPELIHVPLIVRHPDGRGAGTESDWFASTHDVAPTLLSLAGARPARTFSGVDLSPALDGDDPGEERPLAFGGYSNQLFARDDRWALVSTNDRRGAMLFDLESDPGERDDLSKQRPDVVEDLYERVVEEIGGRPPWYSQEQVEASPRRLPGA